MEQFFRYPNAERIYNDGLIVKPISQSGINLDSLKYCKLILHSLEDITEEDAKWICYHFGWNWHEDYPEDDGEASLDRLGVGDLGLDEVFNTDCSSGNKIKEAIDYLRSKNYDIDGYIKSGLAVNSKEVK